MNQAENHQQPRQDTVDFESTCFLPTSCSVKGMGFIEPQRCAELINDSGRKPLPAALPNIQLVSNQPTYFLSTSCCFKGMDSIEPQRFAELIKAGNSRFSLV